MAGVEPTAEPLRATVPINGVYSFLAGAGALGICLGNLVDHASGRRSSAAELAPLWLSLVIAALLLVYAVRAKSMFERLTGVCFSGMFISGAVAARMAEPRVALIIEWLFLGAWGLLVARPWLPSMPAGLARSGAALFVAATSFGFLPGVWKVASLVIMAASFLVALWLVDSLVAKGVIVADKQRAAGESRSRTTKS